MSYYQNFTSTYLTADPFQGRPSPAGPDDGPNIVQVHDQQSQCSSCVIGDQAPSQTQWQSHNSTTHTSVVHDRALLGNGNGTSVADTTSQSNLSRQHPSHPPGDPSPTSNVQLLAARQRQQGLSTTGEENNTGQDRPTIELQVGPTAERAELWQLGYYDLLARDVIECAKQLSHCDAASINLFPAQPTFNSKAIEYIDEAITEH
ncbi:hypothetical protein OG21DRAFT_1491387 [Imleria badia]|nr:hypothetical protein OG21DRAFT_1491387 [Imleria badia]